MTPEDLRMLIKRKPFKPFRITMSTNETFDVSHPDLVVVGRSIAALGLGGAGSDPIADHIIWLDLDQIVHIQPAASTGALAERASVLRHRLRRLAGRLMLRLPSASGFGRCGNTVRHATARIESTCATLSAPLP